MTKPYLPPHPKAYHAQTGRPYVTVTYAQTLDGCIALQQGQPLAISGDGSMRITHELRAAHDAILVGVNTVISDNPRLTVRLAEGDNPQPVILDSHQRYPISAKLTQHERGVIIASTQPKHDALQPYPQLDVLTLPTDNNGQVSLSHLLDTLGQRGITSLMVEGGASVIGSFIRERLANRVIVTIAPVFAGGYHVTHNLNITTADAMPRLHNTQTQSVGEDIILWGDL